MSDSTVFYAVLSERSGSANDQCFNSLLDVAEHAGINGYKHFRLGYSRTDFARNEFIKAFLANSKRDNDLLVMLDCDHKYPADIVSKFAVHDPTNGVVGALAFRRGEPYDPLFFVKVEGALHSLAEFEYGPTYECAIVSTSAISIRRWVLLELIQRGNRAPFFRYEYPTDLSLPSEDMYFGRICEQSGIMHYCDTSIIIPHATQSWVDDKVHMAYLEQHKELVSTKTMEARAAVNT
jgi:hypothetical protein